MGLYVVNKTQYKEFIERIDDEVKAVLDALIKKYLKFNKHNIVELSLSEYMSLKKMYIGTELAKEMAINDLEYILHCGCKATFENGKFLNLNLCNSNGIINNNLVVRFNPDFFRAIEL